MSKSRCTRRRGQPGYFTSRSSCSGVSRAKPCAAVLGVLRDDFDAHEVVATMDVRNVASVKLVESLGFVRDPDTGANSPRGVATEDYRYAVLL